MPDPGKEYHRATRYDSPRSVGLRADPPSPGARRACLCGGRQAAVRLPPPAPRGGLDLAEAMRLRRSVREYAGRPISLGDLSFLLWAASGETGRREHGLAFRTVPSAGGLFPVETYAACREVERVEQGVYRYVPSSHSLEAVRRGDLSGELARAALGQRFVARAAAVFAWTAVVARTTGKYAARGYRYVYMEAGVASENLALAAAALGLGSCAVGAFRDGEVDAILGIDGEEEIALLLQTVGVPAKA